MRITRHATKSESFVNASTMLENTFDDIFSYFHVGSHYPNNEMTHQLQPQDCTDFRWRSRSCRLREVVVLYWLNMSWRTITNVELHHHCDVVNINLFKLYFQIIWY